MINTAPSHTVNFSHIQATFGGQACIMKRKLNICPGAHDNGGAKGWVDFLAERPNKL